MELELISGKYVFRVAGTCPICSSPTTFTASRDNPLDPQWWRHWFRDSLTCDNCGSLPRERALYATIEKYYPNWRELEIHESSPAARGASLKLRAGAKCYTETQYDPMLGFGKIHVERGY